VVRIVILLAGLLVTNSAFGLDPNRKMSQYQRDQWGAEQGFPSGPVYAISQTPDGYLWIGTGSGLVRFDGFSFQLVRDNSGASTITSVLGLTTDTDGCLWLQVQDLTLLSYCNGKFKDPTRLPDYVTTAFAIAPANQGGLFVVESAKGLFRLSRDGSQRLASVGDLRDSFVTTLAQTPNGDVWMGTRGAGIFRLVKGAISWLREGLPDPKVNCLLSLGNEAVWVGTDRGIVRWNGQELTAVSSPPFQGRFQALSMVKDRDENIWAGTDSHGLLRFNSEGVTSLSESEAVTALFEDREGNLWIGSANGLERLRDSTFVMYSRPEGLQTAGSDPLFVDSQNQVWFAPVLGGLRWMKDGSQGSVTDAGLDKDVVYSIGGRNGELWLGRKRGGLTHLRMENGSFTVRSYTKAQGLSQDSVSSVYQARDGTVWAGTLSGGVSRLMSERFTTYSTANGMASNTVASILETSDGTMWFGTPEGLTALSKGSFHSYGTKEGLPSVNIDCLLEDSAGVLWVGTEQGLALKTPGGFRSLLSVPASAKEQILSLAEDGQGWLWISTLRHILRVKRDSLLRDRVMDGDVREYGVADGLRGTEGRKGPQSVVIDRLGRVWISLNRGISLVDPARLIRDDSSPVMIHLQTISADNSPVEVSSSIHIPAGRKRITFHFIGLSLSSPERVRFRYQLDPFDHGWSDATTARETAYTNLPPGHYHLRVIASNPQGVWNMNETAIGLDVDPLLRQNFWFQASCVAAFLAMLWGLHRYRLHQIAHQFNTQLEARVGERTRIARDLHDTLLQSFQGLLLRFQVVDESLPPGHAKEELEIALDLAARAITEGRDTVQGLRSSTVETNDLARAIGALGKELAGDEINPNRAESYLVVEGTPRDLHPILRDEVYRIAGEALRNAFRHAQARRIDVAIGYGERQFRLSVRDNGKGIDPEVLDGQARAGHWGLPGMRERAELIGGKLEVWSQRQSGTEVELKIRAAIAYAAPSAGRRSRLLKKMPFARKTGKHS